MSKQTTIYFIPGDPTSPKEALPRIRAHAKRVGFRVQRDRYAPTFSLIDARLGVPLLGYDHVGLPAIAHAVEIARVAVF
jgi:hypothetical protein